MEEPIEGEKKQKHNGNSIKERNSNFSFSSLNHLEIKKKGKVGSSNSFQQQIGFLLVLPKPTKPRGGPPCQSLIRNKRGQLTWTPQRTKLWCIGSHLSQSNLYLKKQKKLSLELLHPPFIFFWIKRKKAPQVKNPTVQTSSTAVIQREGIKSEIGSYWMNREPN